MGGQGYGEGGGDCAGGNVHGHEDADRRCRLLPVPERCGVPAEDYWQESRMETGTADGTGHRKQAGHGTGVLGHCLGPAGPVLRPA